LGEERKLRVFENRVLRKTFGLKRDEVTGEWRRQLNKELMICTPHLILFELSNQEERDRQGMLAHMGRGEVLSKAITSCTWTIFSAISVLMYHHPDTTTTSAVPRYIAQTS
jgi:hypothetical protein